MQLLCLPFVACLLALLTSCESFLLVVKSGCGRAPAQRFLMSTINDLPTRVALLEQSLGTTNEKLTTINTKIDNLSKDTKKMIDDLSKDTKKIIDDLDKKIDTKIDSLSKDTKTMFEKLEKKLDEIAANQIAFSKHNTFMFHAHNVWLTVLTIVGGMLNIDNARGWFKK